MIIWLVKLEEPLPIDKNYRPYRMDMLAKALNNNGHKVVRWVSDRNHQSGENRFNQDTTVKYNSKLIFKLLNSGINYIKPVSIKRIIDNLIIAYKYYKNAQRLKAPDLIVCAMPTPELAMVSSIIGKKYCIPVIIDARDYWPDVFESALPTLKKVLIWPLIQLMKYNLKIATRNNTVSIGITEFYRNHLLNYAKRPINKNYDAVFHLGYPALSLEESDVKITNVKQYWENLLGKDWNNYNRKIIYFAGRFNDSFLNEIKPVVTLLETAEKLWPNYFFVFCGSGQSENQIKSHFKKFNNIVTPGEVDPDNLIYLRNESYLALQPIQNRVDYLNSLSNKFFEYISSGLPIVTSLKGLTEKEIIKNKIGFVYYNEDELLEKFGELYENESHRNEMSQLSKQLFDNKYSADIIYNKYAKHCVKIIKQLKITSQ